MLENNLVLKNFSCIDDSELAESQAASVLSLPASSLEASLYFCPVSSLALRMA